jgi:hypothetical protein
MKRKLIVGMLAPALLMSGALVGVSFGGGGGITQPEVIELSLDLCGDSCRGFELRDPVFGRRGKAWITLSQDPLLDVDGNQVGFQSELCTVSYGPRGGTPWVCTFLLKLKAGPHTERGTVVTTGIYRFSDPTRFAVTGGTGGLRERSRVRLLGGRQGRREEARGPHAQLDLVNEAAGLRVAGTWSPAPSPQGAPEVDQWVAGWERGSRSGNDPGAGTAEVGATAGPLTNRT